MLSGISTAFDYGEHQVNKWHSTYGRVRRADVDPGSRILKLELRSPCRTESPRVF